MNLINCSFNYVYCIHLNLQLDDWGMTMNEVTSGQNLRPGIDYDTIVDNDYPSIYAERPILIPRKPVEIFETSPPPKEIASAISLLKDYMIEGDAAIQKHKPKVVKNQQYHDKLFQLDLRKLIFNALLSKCNSINT